MFERHQIGNSSKLDNGQMFTENISTATDREESVGAQRSLVQETVGQDREVVVESSEQLEEFANAAHDEMERVDVLDVKESAAQMYYGAHSGAWNIPDGSTYVNEYQVPAIQAVEGLAATITKNRKLREEPEQEKTIEKPPNAVSEILKNKNALCIHFITGRANENNSSELLGLPQSQDPTPVDIRKRAVVQLETLASLSPSISTSFVADSHMLDDTWWRGSSQYIGVILREGVCTEIAERDMASRSKSPKSRSSGKTTEYLATPERVDKVLSPESSTFVASGYNEAYISDPKIGGLFIPNQRNTSRMILEKLKQESDTYGYPLYVESRGRFYQLSALECDRILSAGTSEYVSLETVLTDEKHISRDSVRAQMKFLDSGSVYKKETDRFTAYTERYNLKPHFEWSRELDAAIKAQVMVHIYKEQQKLHAFQERWQVECEEKEALAHRLHTYFSAHPELCTITQSTEYYVDGELWTWDVPPMESMNPEVRTTKKWEYEEDVVHEEVSVEGVVGMCERYATQVHSRKTLRIIQFPNGNVFFDPCETVRLELKTYNSQTDELLQTRQPFKYSTSEFFDVDHTTNTIAHREEHEGVRVEDSSFSTLPVVLYGFGDDVSSILNHPERIAEEIKKSGLDSERARELAVTARTFAAALAKVGDETGMIAWERLADEVPGSQERSVFIASKLNPDGTLRLDAEDIDSL